MNDFFVESAQLTTFNTSSAEDVWVPDYDLANPIMRLVSNFLVFISTLHLSIDESCIFGCLFESTSIFKLD
jgi:hypothetical protein